MSFSSQWAYSSSQSVVKSTLQVVVKMIIWTWMYDIQLQRVIRAFSRVYKRASGYLVPISVSSRVGNSTPGNK